MAGSSALVFAQGNTAVGRVFGSFGGSFKIPPPMSKSSSSNKNGNTKNNMSSTPPGDSSEEMSTREAQRKKSLMNPIFSLERTSTFN